MMDFIVNVVAVVVGIAAYKWIDEKRQDILWRWQQRHRSGPEPWDDW